MITHNDSSAASKPEIRYFIAQVSEKCDGEPETWFPVFFRAPPDAAKAHLRAIAHEWFEGEADDSLDVTQDSFSFRDGDATVSINKEPVEISQSTFDELIASGIIHENSIDDDSALLQEKHAA